LTSSVSMTPCRLTIMGSPVLGLQVKRPRRIHCEAQRRGSWS
jgi:hypothetical protein